MPVTLPRLVSNISRIPNPTNALLIGRFLEFLKNNDTSETHQKNSVKGIIHFANYVAGKKPTTLISDGASNFHQAYLKEYRNLARETRQNWIMSKSSSDADLTEPVRHFDETTCDKWTRKGSWLVKCPYSPQMHPSILFPGYLKEMTGLNKGMVPAGPSLTYLARIMGVLVSRGEVTISNLAMLSRVNHKWCIELVGQLEHSGYTETRTHGGKRYIMLTEKGYDYGNRLLEIIVATKILDAYDDDTSFREAKKAYSRRAP